MNKKILDVLGGAALIIAVAILASKMFSGSAIMGKKPVYDAAGNVIPTRAPDFTLKTMDGGIIKLSDYKGKVIILDFWATWCPPCKAEIPGFVEIYNKYKNDGLVVIGAALDDEAKVKKFIAVHNVSYPVVMADQDTVDAYGGARGIPTTFVIDKEGNIAKQYVGYTFKEVFIGDFERLKSIHKDRKKTL